MYERIDQASVLRQEQLLKSQALQSASLDGTARYFLFNYLLYFIPNLLFICQFMLLVHWYILSIDEQARSSLPCYNVTH